MRKKRIFNLIYQNFNLPFLDVMKAPISYTNCLTHVPILIIAYFIKETIQFPLKKWGKSVLCQKHRRCHGNCYWQSQNWSRLDPDPSFLFYFNMLYCYCWLLKCERLTEKGEFGFWSASENKILEEPCHLEGKQPPGSSLHIWQHIGHSPITGISKMQMKWHLQRSWELQSRCTNGE